ncbi:MAG: ATP-binding cassette domain-containing protein [Clostridia bacterium]|nr:ATP-binding cassette domain-containing protein [Clostridia bacterium]
MLKLVDIKKDYLSASDKVEALKGINLAFRNNEFVSILGPSGCGKTTMLNLIGGLDHYTSGDLVISGKSTKDFKDSDWDTYRNHSIGFVFQSYNLIPHQSVLANVELALTLSGVSKAERRRRAESALEKVGLKDQIKKRPNQLSGGQMQRVAIARALVNDPEILLADEPTGALDSVTSLQIMELLKEISREKLVIMVTHNPELAEEYSSRIIRLRDGEVVDDTNPFDGNEVEESKKAKKDKKPTMSFFTALSLSMNNLMTKKGRTILTSFAGSIGIIGIALILSLSNGINAYIHSVQEETLSSYPLTIQAESVDMSALMTTLMGINEENAENKHDLDAVYSSSVMGDMLNSLNSAKINTNNLTLFKEFLDSDEEIRKYISNIQYSYDLDMHVYTEDKDGTLIKSDVEQVMMEVMAGMGMDKTALNNMSASAASSGMGFSSIKLWQEMLPDENGKGISPLLKEQYDVIYGSWPKAYNETVLVVSENNELSDVVLCGLGLISIDEVTEAMQASQKGELLDTTVRSWSYEDICQKKFKIFLPTDLYQKNPAGGYTLLTDTEKGINYLFGSEKGVTIKISGIVRLNEDANAGMLTGALGYTTALTDHLLEQTKNSPLILEQTDHPEKDIITDLPFLPEDFVDYSEEEKISMIKEYFSGLSTEKKAEIYTQISSVPSDEYLNNALSSLDAMSRAELEMQVSQALTEQEKEGTDTSYILEYIKNMSDDELREAIRGGMEEQIKAQYAEGVKANLAAVPKEQLAMMLTAAIQTPEAYTDAQWISFYEDYMPATHSDQTLEENLELLGLVKKESPSSISIYTDTFENKDAIAELIDAYNEQKEEEDQIEYTDLFAIMMSGIATIINAISYVLVAFVSISLVVSSIMIGIITYISVLERTKEIGILRAIGASKRDISRVFNAESIIEGFAAGFIGIGLTLLLIIPINIVIRHLTGIQTLGAELPTGGYILILVSVLLSFIAGLFPSKFAANKDPVEALRTE